MQLIKRSGDLHGLATEPQRPRKAAAILQHFFVVLTAWLFGVTATQAEERAFAIAITDGTVPAAETTLRVTEGDEVVLMLTSDSDLSLHLHGYDLEVALTAGQPGELSFTATFSGRFPLESHDATTAHGHATLLYLEVYPD